jgi:lipid-A-disaccharide synthase
LELPIAYFGHPLAGQYHMRPPRGTPPAGGGTVALLPGSRSGELRRHLPALAAAYRVLQNQRPALSGVFGAADPHAREQIARAVAAFDLRATRIVDGVEAALREADAAWVASGTAVLECALSGVPAVALYIIAPVLAKHGRTMIKHRYITLPNLVLGREVVPELLQEAATPERLASEMDRVLHDPSVQYAAFGELRTALGPGDALERCAQFAVELARTATA